MGPMGQGKTHTKTAQGRKARPAAASGVSWTQRGNMRPSSLDFILGSLLAVATVALYSPVAGYLFVALDDHDYVTGNTHVHGGLAWSTIKWAFTTFAAANWHPLTWLSHALDYQLFAMNPAGHHLHSVLVHAVNAVVLFLLLSWITKRVRPSLLVAALFALHPLNVESVAWVSERKNVLSTTFFFLAIAAYAWYARKPDWRRYLAVTGLFAAGLMAKPMVITLPFVLLLLDYWPLQRTGAPGSALADDVPQMPVSQLVAEKLPLLLLSAVSAWITLKAQRSGMAVRSLHEFPLSVRIENAAVSYCLYLWKMFWPARLSALYPHPASALPGVAVDSFRVVPDRRHCVCNCFSSQALFVSGMVLVPGHAGSGHRLGAGRRRCHGGSLRLCSADRHLPDDFVRGRRPCRS